MYSYNCYQLVHLQGKSILFKFCTLKFYDKKCKTITDNTIKAHAVLHV